LTTTATVVAVFIPVAFMGGIPGQFFQPFGVTVATATMFSTLVARLMTPMMAAYLLKSKPVSESPPEWPGPLQSRRLQPYRVLLGAGCAIAWSPLP
jgi:multidrug efflux pump subunit AcrB